MLWSRSVPTEPPRRPAWLTAAPFAHRGLHGRGVPENSRAAFRAAIDAGQGIELDVRACRDGAVVFHDARLERLCRADGPVSRRTFAELGAIRLRASEERIAPLGEILALVGGRVPVLIEIKPPLWGGRRLCRAVAACLAGYDEPAAVMSFSRRTVFWFARHAPGVVRGLVADGRGQRKMLAPPQLVLRLLTPDFLAHDVRSLPSRLSEAARARGLAVLAWTVRSEEEGARAARHADQIIHELR